jgi:phage-related protein
MVKVMEKIKVMEKTNLEQTKDEWGEMAESAWDTLGAAWTSVREAFSEAYRTVARTVDATKKEAMKTANAVTHGVAKGVARFMDGMDVNLQLLINATKDSGTV